MKLKNAKAKGSRLELEARDILVREGFTVIKSGGSLGPADLVALKPSTGHVLFVQVKANRPPPPAEMRELRALKAAVRGRDWSVEVWIRRDRKPWEIKDV